MSSLNQLQQDPRPLVRLDTASEALKESLGSLISRLDDLGIPLFMQRPHDAQMYCLTPSSGGSYQKCILTSPGNKVLNQVSNLSGSQFVFEAKKFEYIVLDNYMYSSLMAGDVTLTVECFRNAAHLSANGHSIEIKGASDYCKEKNEKLNYFERTKARFACYFQEHPVNNVTPNFLSLKTMHVRTSDLMFSRTALLDLSSPIDDNNTLPSELTQHLEPWKSSFLKALNRAAHEVYSEIPQSASIPTEVSLLSIQKVIKNKLPHSEASDTKISLCASLIRLNRQKIESLEHSRPQLSGHYPTCFSYKLKYINDKSKLYYESSLAGQGAQHSATSIEADLNGDNIISKDVARRIASKLKPTSP